MILEEGSSEESEKKSKSIKETCEGTTKRVPQLNGAGEACNQIMKAYSHPAREESLGPSPTKQNPDSEGKNAKHFTLSTPSPRRERPDQDGVRPRSPPGLAARDYPDFILTGLTRHEKKAIARKNMMALFGQAVVLASKCS